MSRNNKSIYQKCNKIKHSMTFQIEIDNLLDVLSTYINNIGIYFSLNLFWITSMSYLKQQLNLFEAHTENWKQNGSLQFHEASMKEVQIQEK